MNNMHPIWDASGTRIICGESGEEIWMDEFQIRRLIGARQLTVNRNARVRKIVLNVDEEQVFPKQCRKLQSAQPFCVKVPVSDTHKAFMHVAERCGAAYDGRSLRTGSDGAGNARYSNVRISASSL